MECNNSSAGSAYNLFDEMPLNVYAALMEFSASGSRSGSFRTNSSSVWRANGKDAFVRSSRKEDDEVALMWAALQRVPTFDRLKKGLIPGLRGGMSEVDIKNIGCEEKKKIIERLIRVPERDNEKFLLKLKDRIDRVAIDIPTVEVRFEHLNVGANAYVGKRALPSITNLTLNILEGLLSYLYVPTNKKHVSILHDVSGIIKPGRMTLLLGPPSSGKTTLLLALAGQLDPEILAELSRREKAANIMPDPDLDIFMKAAATDGQEANVVVDYIIKILGLEGCEDTIVGNELLRGMSGGERKRLTAGEMLVGPANVLLIDEVSTGLDSSTTFQIIKSIKHYVHTLCGTAVISLLQPAPECYDLFDDIILISEGQIVYHGPRDNVLDFFESMGFRCPERKGVADFLQEVTSRKDQMQYWVHKDKPYRFVTVKEFSEAFQSFHIGRNLGDELATPFQKARSHPAALTTKRYGVSKMELLKSCFSREVLLMKRNSALHIFGFTWELAPTIFRLPVFYKQRDLLFYPAWAYAIPTWILRLPLSFIEVSAWVFSAYYVIGYDPDVGSNGGSSKVKTGTGNITCGMILPFEPHSIVFNEIKYSVDMPQEMKIEGVLDGRLELLKGVSGAFRPGVLTALMGVSGAGKTTLMDVLAGRKTGGYIEGDIRLSGFPKKQETFARISGYCEQNDIHSPHLTVYESLTFSAWLRLPSGITSEARNLFIKEVMQLVELDSLKDALVGLPGVNGLSTGQRKRLTIAVELVANPSLIFMDEPTSGLDARAAAIVMRTVRNIVDTGRTIVCTIHQPSIDIFEAFDENIEGIEKIKNGYNPATWVLENTTREKEEALGINFNEIYRKSELYQRNMALIKELSTPPPGSRDLKFSTKYSQSFWTQFVACLYKQRWSYWHNTSYTALRAFFTIVIALMFGTMFWDLGGRRSKAQDLFNAMGSMYAAVLFIGTLNAFIVQQAVAVERTVCYRERAAGMYSALPFSFAMIVVELPYILIQAVIYGTTVYSMIGFEWTARKFLWYLLIMFLTFLYATFLGMMSVAMTPNLQIASILATGSFGIWNLFSGFLIPRPMAPVWWRWYFRLSPVGWTLYGLVASQFGDFQDVLETFDTVENFLRHFFGFRRDFVGETAAILTGFVLLFATMFAFSMKMFNFQKR
ncbi:unnamed protein product [Cuscuta campestris]|uniref:ABC transporter domain-containing protein n=1 Tax=Cuscuta campestris TaxID=132261 RepID=A0A484MFJ9_9ASTE|nr:unnamed protein product [Cuscuta campestris]